MTTADYLESLQDDLSRTVEALDLEEGTNFTDIADMAENGDISTGGGGSGLNWSTIGYSSTPQGIIDGYNYALQIKNNWDATQTSLLKKYEADKNMIIMPLVDTSNVTNMEKMFNNCYGLLAVPLINTSRVTNMSRMFSTCYVLKDIPLLNTSSLSSSSAFYNFVSGDTQLTDTSLENILQMCINATSYTGTKTLAYLGLTSTNYSVSKIQSLPSYDDFIEAGWTIGY